MTPTTAIAAAPDHESGFDLVVTPRRWPLAPLLEATRLTPTRLADELGIAAHNVTHAGRDGLSDVQADRWAIHFGFHPLLVWGWAWIDAAADTTSLQAHIADDLRRRIEAGELRPGDPLPTVGTLAARWRAGSRTVRDATAELVRAGLVAHPGRGRRPFVAYRRARACRSCGACRQPIEPGTEHYPHRPACTLPVAGWCDCDHATHPGCCPTCGGATP